MDKLQIQETAHDRYFQTLMITGLSVDEMNYILDGNGDGTRMDDRLCEIMHKRTGMNYDDWRYGYGIYSIRHVGGHLLVQVGNNCD